MEEKRLKPSLSKLSGIRLMKIGYEDANEKNKAKVFLCGGGNEVSDIYYNEAYNVGKLLASLNVAYGQGGLTDRNTIMGESYWGYKDAGGNSAYLFVREAFKNDVNSEFNSEGIKRIYCVDSIGELLKAQYLWSDISVIMPGRNRNST